MSETMSFHHRSQRTCAADRARYGFSLLELQVSFVLLTIALAGLCPLVVIQSKQLRKVEQRLDSQTVHYLIPSTNAWARKLGASATVQTTDPGPPAAAPTLLIDDGDAGCTTVGTAWHGGNSSDALGGSYQWYAAGGGEAQATWTFTGLPPGSYRVEATWPAKSNAATDAPFAITDGTSVLTSLTVDQTRSPAGDTYLNLPWTILGTVSVTGGKLQVVLNNGASGRVLADGVRLVSWRNTVQVLSLDRSLTSEDQTAHVTVTAPGP